jgi:phosphoribosylaminoimidazolecarboxamide formyltransferase / IMP cyclohydrolase
VSKVSALISVSDKSGLADFARRLSQAGVSLISTGGTAKHLREAGLQVQDISEITHFPEIMDGRVKTLHPAVHGGILARRDLAEHMDTLASHGFNTIDFVVVNLYPFVETIQKPGITLPEAIEQIDIGGPSMLRSAAKNFASVTVVSDPSDYEKVAQQLEGNGETSLEFRTELATKVFIHTSQYDAAIANHLSANSQKTGEAAGWPQVLNMSLPLAQTMRYGENPHQAAAYYRDPACQETSISNSEQLHGKELSYNNILDAEGALEMVRDFADLAPGAAVIVKHSNPCGIAIGDTLIEAYERARSCDPDSAFGGVLAFSAEVDVATAEAISKTFNEIVLAPSFTPEALEILTKKKNLRLLATGAFTPKTPYKVVRGVIGGVLVMERDLDMGCAEELKVVSKKQPSEKDLKGLLFSWRCVKWVKSNAIVYTNHTQTVGIGVGQMSRIDAANFGVEKARTPLDGCFMASDAFFPFRDCVDIAAGKGISAIIQPGGSIRDEDSILAADEHDLVLVFTGKRHFRH